MIDLKKYSCIIWDWNGTLLDDAWLCVDVMNGMLKERYLPLKTIEEYMELFDFPVKDYYAKLGYDFDTEPFNKVGMEFINRYNVRQGETRLHPGAVSVLETFKARGFDQSILSAREQKELLTETTALGVHGFFNRIYGLDDHYAHGKTEVGFKLVHDLGIPEEKMLYLGDTRHDAEVAVEIGIDCILIANGHHSQDRLQQLGVPLIASLTELNKLLW